MALSWVSPWDVNNEWYNKMLASGQSWSDYDLRAAMGNQAFANEMFEAKNDYANATTDEARALAHARGEKAREPFQYSGGAMGNEYLPFGSVDSMYAPGASAYSGAGAAAGAAAAAAAGAAAGAPSSAAGAPSSAAAGTQPSGYWQNEKQETYNSVKNAPAPSYTPYQAPAPFTYQDFKAQDAFQYDPYESSVADFQHSDAYNQAMKEALDYAPFSYDYSEDPLYNVYKKEYAREGRRASEEALALSAMLTGGVPSSYANTAAQQAANYYAAQLADKIPELRNQAYNEWLGGYNNALSRYNVAAQGEQFDYGMNQDQKDREYRQYLDDLNMRYGLYSDDYNRAYQRWQDKANLDYGLYSDEYDRGYKRWQDQTELDRENNETNYARLLDRYALANENEATEYQRSEERKQEDDAKQLDMAKLLSAMGDQSGYDEYFGSGTRLQDAWAAAETKQQREEIAAIAADMGDYSYLEQQYGVPAGTLQSLYDAGKTMELGNLMANMGDMSVLEQYYGVPAGTLQKLYDANNDSAVYAYGSGSPYKIGSWAGKAFVMYAKPGQEMDGGDGSHWKVENNGDITITRNGETWTIKAEEAAKGGGRGGGRSSGSDDDDGNSSGGDKPVNVSDILSLGGPMSAEGVVKRALERGYEIVEDDGEYRIIPPGQEEIKFIPATGFNGSISGRFGS